MDYEFKEFMVQDATLGDVYEEDKKNFEDKGSAAAKSTIAESLANIMEGNLAKAKVFIENVADVEVAEDFPDRVYFKLMGQTYFIKVGIPASVD